MASKVLVRIPAEQRAAEVGRAAADMRWMASMADEIPASALNDAQKQLVWAHLKARHPERVAFLSDPATKALMRATGAVPTFPRAIVREALQPQQRSTRHASASHR